MDVWRGVEAEGLGRTRVLEQVAHEEVRVGQQERNVGSADLAFSQLVLGVCGHSEPGEDDEVETDRGPQSVGDLRHRDGAELGTERHGEPSLATATVNDPSAWSGCGRRQLR